MALLDRGIKATESDYVKRGLKTPKQRKEFDNVKILSGIFEGKTTGTPISMIIYNKDAKSRDYETIKNKFTKAVVI